MSAIVSLPEPMVLGLHALGFIAREEGKCFTTQQIAQGLQTPEPHLSKVLQRLNKGGLIKSVRGPGGGYKLNCVPQNTPLKKVFEVLGGAFMSSGCGMDGCKGGSCFIGDMMDELTRALIRYLESRTMADFVEYYNEKTPVEIEISVITPSLGQVHPNFAHLGKLI
ncbi:MAG: Rrf2 family transcriptional regulator [Synergistaceae bacterium]